MSIPEKVKKLQILFKNKKFDELIKEIEKTKDKNSLLLNISGVSKILRNNATQNDKLSALENFEKAYLMDSKSQVGLDSLTNFINVAIEFGKFEKIFTHYNQAIKNFENNNKLLEAIQRVYQHQYKIFERNKILKKMIDNKTKSYKIWSSYLYTNNFLTEFNSQKYHYNAAKNFDEILTDFNLSDLKLDKNIHHRKISVAFFSSDLIKDHSVTFFLRGLLKNFDKNKFELIAVGNWKDKEFVNKKISSYFDKWFSISNYSDLDAINFIRSKKIDVVFDIMGMTGENRPILFKNRIAPIQINWLGYCNTSGIKKMDYIFADPNLIYKDEEKYYFEKVKMLPRIWNCHYGLSVERKYPSFLKKNVFTFGSFNNLNKISTQTLDCWEKILKDSKNSRLILKSSLEYFPDYIETKLKKRGIFDQISILKKTKFFDDHIEKYNQIDLALDTFPYNGVTTTFEALCKLVPVLTLKGYNFKSRCGYSILKNLGIDYLIANTLEDYVSKAVYLSKNPEYFQNIKESLFLKIRRSSLFDNKSFADEFQNLILVCINEKLQSLET